MIIDVNNSSINIGAYGDTQQLINLPHSEALDFSFMAENHTRYSAALNDQISSDNKINRLVDLLLQLKLADQQAWLAHRDKPVFWLLPNMPANELQQLVSIFHQHFPHCFEHPLCRFFPQGSAALMYALGAFKLLQSSDQDVVFISVDSLFFELNSLPSSDVLITEAQASGTRLAEAAIICTLTAQLSGINVELLLQDNCSLVQQTQMIQNLFEQANTVCKPNLLRQLYLPSFNQQVLDNWLNAYEQLAGRIDSDSVIFQTTHFTGDIGCVAGLYNLLHLYNRYKQQTVTGKSLQLEVSQTLNLGLAMYSWIEKA